MHADNLFEAITSQLIADIEAGAGTWRMPWHCLADIGTPTSADGRPYRGMNGIWLPMCGAAHGFRSGLWSTYRSWQRHGAQVRRGEQGTQVILWKPTTRTDSSTDGGGDEPNSRRGLIARAFTVFAAEQVDGAEALIARRNRDRVERDTPERIADADRYFAVTGATIIEGGNRAFYAPAADEIHVPTIDQFETASSFHARSAMRPPTGQDMPTASPATSPADSGATCTRLRNSSPNSARRCGPHRWESQQSRGPTTPATWPVGYRFCALTPGRW